MLAQWEREGPTKQKGQRKEGETVQIQIWRKRKDKEDKADTLNWERRLIGEKKMKGNFDKDKK